MRWQLILGLVGAWLWFFAAPAATAPADEKADPTGTWKWKTNVMGQEIESQLKLKRDGDKLTGMILGDDKEVKIEDGKFEKGEISFKALRTRMGQEVLAKYKGKLDGDTIKGKITVEVGGEGITLDWNAKRVKDEKKKDK
jgi:hypothetical protein